MRVIFACLLMVLSTGLVAGNGPVWLLIDTDKLLLKVMRADKVERLYENISIGKNGVGKNKKRGDEKTPLGTFKIGWINRNSRYHLFFGFTYPSLEIAKRGFASGTIDFNMYHEIRAAKELGRVPPQNSPLGGQIGIHGLGDADPAIHQAVNWTGGCIALTNEQIDSLDEWIFRGMRVVVF
jgi:murein L,D-transpeptidase YafK